MDISRSLLPQFFEFVYSTTGVKPIIHQSPQQAEYGRFMVKGNFCCVRELGEEITTSENLEVFCSDKDTLQELDRSWQREMMLIFKDVLNPLEKLDPELEAEINKSIGELDATEFNKDNT